MARLDIDDRRILLQHSLDTKYQGIKQTCEILVSTHWKRSDRVLHCIRDARIVVGVQLWCANCTSMVDTFLSREEN